MTWPELLRPDDFFAPVARFVPPVADFRDAAARDVLPADLLLLDARLVAARALVDDDFFAAVLDAAPRPFFVAVVRAALLPLLRVVEPFEPLREVVFAEVFFAAGFLAAVPFFAVVAFFAAVPFDEEALFFVLLFLAPDARVLVDPLRFVVLFAELFAALFAVLFEAVREEVLRDFAPLARPLLFFDPAVDALRLDDAAFFEPALFEAARLGVEDDFDDERAAAFFVEPDFDEDFEDAVFFEDPPFAEAFRPPLFEPLPVSRETSFEKRLFRSS